MTTLGQLLGELQEVERSLFRQYERTLQRISCAETNCIFNQTCLTEELLPKNKICNKEVIFC